MSPAHLFWIYEYLHNSYYVIKIKVLRINLKKLSYHLHFDGFYNFCSVHNYLCMFMGCFFAILFYFGLLFFCILRLCKYTCHFWDVITFSTWSLSGYTVGLLWKVYNWVSEYDISSRISDIHLLTCLHFSTASYWQYAQYVFFKIYVFHIMKATYVYGKNEIIFWYLHILFFNVLEDYIKYSENSWRLR